MQAETLSTINSSSTGSYFEKPYAIVRVGKYEPGTDVEVRLTIRLNNTKRTDTMSILS